MRLLANVWGAKWLILVAIVIAVLFAWVSAPLQYDGLLEGRIAGSFVRGASKAQTQSIVVDIVLRDGQRVSLTLPKTVAYRPDAEVEIAAYHRAGPITGRAFKFRRYLDAAG